MLEHNLLLTFVFATPTIPWDGTCMTCMCTTPSQALPAEQNLLCCIGFGGLRQHLQHLLRSISCIWMSLGLVLYPFSQQLTSTPTKCYGQKMRLLLLYRLHQLSAAVRHVVAVFGVESVVRFYIIWKYMLEYLIIIKLCIETYIWNFQIKWK